MHMHSCRQKMHMHFVAVHLSLCLCCVDRSAGMASAYCGLTIDFLVMRVLHVQCEWCTKVRKMKAIYHTLNQFTTSSSSSVGLASLASSSSSQKALIGECWCPVKHLDIIHRALRRGMVRLF